VEELRTACRDRRRQTRSSGAVALEELHARVRALPLETSVKVARAFSLFFVLINTAEQVHRVRRRNSYKRSGALPQPASPRWALEELARRGAGPERVRSLLRELSVRPVLTAHPTEARRRTLLMQEARIAEALLRRDAAPDSELTRLEEALEAEIEILWLTDEVRRYRPSVMDEIGTVTWYLESRLVEARARVTHSVSRAYERVFGEELGFCPSFTFGSWVGGDRDGNPLVTPELTRTAARRAACALLLHYRRRIDDLIERLPLSDNVAEAPLALSESLERDRAALPEVPRSLGTRFAHEPVRLKLLFVRARLDAFRAELEARESRDGAESVARARSRSRAAYGDARELAADLELVRDALVLAGAEHAAQSLLEPVIEEIGALGFSGYRLDVREDGEVHTRALAGIANQLAEPELDAERLRRELLGKRPLVSNHVVLDEATRRTVDVFFTLREIQDELGEAAASTYIVSMTRGADDLLRVLLLAREAGLVDLSSDPARSRLDVVPLFETQADLEHAPRILQELIDDPAYERQLRARRMRQEIMLGYSDSAKDAGVVAAAWSLQRTQQALARVAEGAGIKLTLFHGRGGTVGRGGGSPVFRALGALPPGSLSGGIKITEQGEIISQKFGIDSIAERSLEVMLTGTLMAMASPAREPEPAHLELMDELAALSAREFRRLVHDHDALFENFLRVTPVRELEHVHFGSRPAYRDGRGGTLDGIRAIPWNFGWMQVRLLIPAWLGAGKALSTIAARPGGLARLREMAKTWAFFADLLDKIAMVCAKTDLDVARLYFARLGGSLELFSELSAEYELTKQSLLAIQQTRELLEGHRFLRAALALRNPYVDALLALGLGTTLNGIAYGMRNTG